ncbi:MAG: GNAT family N-acetyltransferase [Cellvibrionaceae bacterium]
MKILIEQAGLGDVERLSALFDQYRIFYGQKSHVELARSFIEARITTQTSQLFYAQNELGDALGFTQLYPSFSSVSAQHQWILNDLYVQEEFRFKGVARALLNKAKDFAMQDGAKGLALSTAKDNIAAQALYESLGYKQDTAFFHYYLSVQPSS